MTTFCAHPGCIAALQDGNLSGVCRDHFHGVACRCAVCRRPRKAGKRARVRRQRVTRVVVADDGLLLPGMEETVITKGTGR